MKPLTQHAKATGRTLGKVSVDVYGSSCEVPVALDSIRKIEASGCAGRKRRTIRC